MSPCFTLMSILLVAVVSLGGAVYGLSYVPAAPGSRPACARGTATFCENVDSYPKDLIQRLLQYKPSSVQGMFTDESEGLDEPPEHILHQDMPGLYRSSKERKTRSLGREVVMNLLSSFVQCPVTTRFIVPEAGMNVDGEWRYIAQRKDSRRKLRVQVCNFGESNECANHCTQLYKMIRMESLNIDGTLRKETFWMPSICSCPSRFAKAK